MELTEAYIKQRIDYFNRLIFNGELPPIEIVFTTAKTFLAKCVYRERRNLLGKKIRDNFYLKFNRILNLSADEIDDIIIHEMIHYYIGFKKLRDTSAHGRVFRQMMQEINARYDRNISISYKSTNENAVERTGKPVKWHAVAVVTLKDGRIGIKVLPRIVQRITKYYYAVSAQPDVKDVSIFLARHPVFEALPNSSALKIYFVNPSVLQEALKEASRMEVLGKDSIRKAEI